ncbi:uncharacterized protein LOC119723477 [Patiria miniata]|uniref:Uncharacterized protein n=1 Tax=Patiria miniata TaxID=46514 RepID=A0A913ZE66_PATMI|nr:uncharacterized protein LOC119723477 [Patiria miniata]XP_038050079.1 uncharacterized protein LOC119723477 [Patiria miniata]XP_038050080.1 uncharacterized protein LOC119723477 [Patiria miniata]
MESCIPAGKTRYPRKTQTAVSYQHLDCDFITASRQDAATRRSRHHARANTLPKIATGRSVRSAKKLWEDYECIEVRSRVQTENEKQPEVPPLRVPKNPHSLYKHPVKAVKPFHILHSPSDYGEAKHQLRELYAQVTYLTNAVRNCDGSASYKGMCKRQRSYRSDDNNPLHLHWPSSDDTIPIPRLLLPVMPGTNTKWYSWKVDTPREVASPRGRGEHLGRGSDKRVAASAPVSRSLDFLERYGKNASRVAFTVDDTEGRRSKNSKNTDTKSRDGHLSVRTLEGTEVTESLASSSLSSIVKYDAGKFKLKEHEVIAGKAIFLTQSEPRKMSSVQEMHTDVAGVSCHGDEEEKGKETKTVRTTSDNVTEEKDEGLPDVVREQTPEDEMDVVARANVAATEPSKNAALEEPQNSTQDAAVASEDLQQDTKLTEQVSMGTVNELAETGSDNGHENDSGDATRDDMQHSKDNASVTMATDGATSNHDASEDLENTEDVDNGNQDGENLPAVTMATDGTTSNHDASEEPENTEDVDNENQDGENVPADKVEESPDNLDSGKMSQDKGSSCEVEEDNEQKDNNSGDASKETLITDQSEDNDT